MQLAFTPFSVPGYSHPGLAPLAVSSLLLRILRMASAVWSPTNWGGGGEKNRRSISMTAMPNLPRQQAHWPQAMLCLHLGWFGSVGVPFLFTLMALFSFLCQEAREFRGCFRFTHLYQNPPKIGGSLLILVFFL